MVKEDLKGRKLFAVLIIVIVIVAAVLFVTKYIRDNSGFKNDVGQQLHFLSDKSYEVILYTNLNGHNSDDDKSAKIGQDAQIREISEEEAKELINVFNEQELHDVTGGYDYDMVVKIGVTEIMINSENGEAYCVAGAGNSKDGWGFKLTTEQKRLLGLQ